LIEIKPSKQIIDISGNKVVSVNEIVSICENVVGKKALVQFVPTPIGDQEKTIGNIKQAEKILGVTQYTTVEFGIREQFKELKGVLIS
jgi:nucleoside-diphosphate-sugar epimerase